MNAWALWTLVWLSFTGFHLWFGPEDETEEEIDFRSKMVNVGLILALLNALAGCFGGSI